MTSPDLRWLLAVVLLAETLGFIAFVWDKLLARGGRRRIPERQLLMFVLIGGVGAWIGAHLVRHKTRKQPFRTWMSVVLTLHLGLLLAAALIIGLRA